MRLRPVATWLFALATLLPNLCRAAGGISHVYMAHEAIAEVQHSELRTLLAENDNAYAVGACYADSGYVAGATYGELSHWDAFIFAFADHLKAQFANPTRQAPGQVAFLMGCANHRVSDELFHWVLLNDVAEHDFGGDWAKAHTFGDLGLDILLTVDKGLWFNHQSRWYVPVSDLVATYQSLGYAISAQEIVGANALYYFAGLAERLMAPVTYAAYKTRGPWSHAHYLDTPAGGYRASSLASARYMDKLWNYLKDAQAPRPSVPRYSSHIHDGASPSRCTAHETLEPAPFEAVTHKGSDGSVTIERPRGTDVARYLSMLDAIARHTHH